MLSPPPSVSSSSPSISSFSPAPSSANMCNYGKSDFDVWTAVYR
jgi:hypothetical protein